MISQIHDREFALFQRLLYETAGIRLQSTKKMLVAARLAKRLKHYRTQSYGEYFRLLESGSVPAELQVAIDLLTTNETYFFREPKHFEFLRAVARAPGRRARPFCVWSAASSSGEEAYSSAMVLADCLGAGAWQVLGSDISTRVLRWAQAGHYPMERAKHIPAAYLKRFCLRGTGRQQGTLLIDPGLRKCVSFAVINLNTPLPHLGPFDVVFLRNVMIYFDAPKKREIVERVLSVLKPRGHLLVGHAESLHGVTDAVRVVVPAVYEKR